MQNLSLSSNLNFDWIQFTKGVFDNCSYTYEWETQTFIADIWLKQVMQVRLQDQLRQFWLSTLDDSPNISSVQNFQANSGISKLS
jgi:hypothetical protein